ncbi:calcium-binding protein [Pseudomonas congelans]|uniref:calcium-binding protein n=1 Tax=Pseudomonas congelans TaxID=200452 RepID=UPI001BDD6D97|nr:calcium-binding protein [Pseudomonas congelans]QVX10743.1 hypothetical protein DBV21_13070 [Pseudomonas congelans]
MITAIRDQYGNELAAANIVSLLSKTPINVHDNLVGDALTAQDGNTLLFGAGGNDTMITYGGNTVMNGGSGEDLYGFFGGAGVIEDSEGSDTVVFVNGSSIEDIQNRMSKSNGDLLIDFGNAAGDTLTVKGFLPARLIKLKASRMLLVAHLPPAISMHRSACLSPLEIWTSTLLFSPMTIPKPAPRPTVMSRT